MPIIEFYFECKSLNPPLNAKNRILIYMLNIESSLSSPVTHVAEC